MFAIKLLIKLLLFPVWLVLLICWLPVHVINLICGMLHGIGKFVMLTLAVLSLGFGMWQNVIVFVAVIVVTFMFVLAGAIVETIISESRRGIGRYITA